MADRTVDAGQGATIVTERPRRLDDFEGRWRLTRSIRHADAADARFEGEATWARDGQDLRYVETGLLRIGAETPMRAERQYLWRPDLSVWFMDGRFFHTVPPAGGETTHWCDPDDYAVAYDFGAWPRFSVTWHVNGPRKSYRIDSSYEHWI